MSMVKRALLQRVHYKTRIALQMSVSLIAFLLYRIPRAVATRRENKYEKLIEGYMCPSGLDG
jgi:hypothetical protein